MLEGVQILNATVKWTAGIGEFIAFIVCGLTVIFLVSLAIINIITKDFKASTSVSIFIFAFLWGICSFLFGFDYFTRTQYKEYQVTINNSVNFNEFNKKYEIIRQEGKIYTIIKKSE